MHIGFGKVDITPRVGVELCGFGAYLIRSSIGVRDRLWARALACEAGGRTVVLVANDLIGVSLSTTRRVRELVGAATGLPPEAVMVNCSHTHSGPNSLRSGRLTGFGVVDDPYLEILPQRIAAAAIQAVGSLRPATLTHVEVPCEGIGLNREYDLDAPPLEEVLREDWRPAKPELTDTTCHVLKAVAEGGELLGFASYFGCHPVTCCDQTRLIHGDFVGVATNLLEREHPGSTGLFLQGAQGNVNSCVVHQPAAEALLALDVIAARYANAVRAGLEQPGRTLEVGEIRCVRQEVTFSREKPALEELDAKLAEQEAILHQPEARDGDPEVRMATLWAQGYRSARANLAARGTVDELTEVQGFRLGPLALLGEPFETFQAIKNDVVAAATAPIPLVLGVTNDLQGYATDHFVAERGGYAAQTVPIMLGTLPYRDVHTELVAALLELDRALGE